MSGHSKWSQIKRQKQAGDVARGLAFSKLANQISGAVKAGGKDPLSNMRLRLVLSAAKTASMPKESIERAIKRGAGELAGQNEISEVTYEAFGPGGVAFLIQATTDNKNRTSSDIRATLLKHGGKLSESGGVRHLFEPKGLIDVEGKGEEIFEGIVDAGAQDVEETSAGYLIYTEPTATTAVAEALAASGINIKEAKISFEPKTSIFIPTERASEVLKLLEALDSLEDVTEVYSNFDVPEQVLSSV
jgi:YebC/PmpR family DNA-binding regulatory protein